MIRHPRRASSICNKLLLTGTTLALLTAGCGGGGDGGGGTGGMIGKTDAAKLDTAPIQLPDTAVAVTTGGTISSPDVGAGGAGGTAVDVGAGGAGGAKADAAPDMFVGMDGGTGGVIGPDAADVAQVDQALPRDLAKPDTTSSIDTGPYVCPAPAKAWAFLQIPSLSGIAWNQDGSLVSGSTYYGTGASISFGPNPADPAVTPVNLTNNGSADILISKLDPANANPKWVFAAGDPKDQKVTGVASTTAGIGAVGTFTGTLEIVTGTPIVNSASTLIDYIAGFKGTDGTGVWSKKVNLGGGQLVAIASQPSKDYFVVCGSAMNAAANLGSVGTPGGGKDVVVAAVKASDGTILWSKLFGGASDQECLAAALDDDGNAIFAGRFVGDLDFGLGALPSSTASADGGAQGSGVLWVAKLNGATGATMAAKSFGTTATVIPASVATDAQGSVVVAGQFSGSSLAFGTTVLTMPAGYDSFVAKLDSNLASFWAKGFVGGGSSPMSAGSGVAVDSRGMVTVVGNFKGTLDLGPGSLGGALDAGSSSGRIVLTSAMPTTTETFVATLDGNNGQTLCAHNYGDAAAKGGGATSIVINRWATGADRDAIAIAGAFTYVLDFGPPTTALSAQGALRAYLLRM